MKKENLKNVVITFGLIGLVFTQGSLMYQKKLYKGVLDTNKLQEELISTQNETLAKIENDNLIDQQNSQITQAPSAVPKTTSPSSTTTTDKTKTQADIITKAQQAALLAKQEADALADAQQAALIAQQQADADAAAARAKLLAQQQADAKAAAAAAARKSSSSSRQSSAS